MRKNLKLIYPIFLVFSSNYIQGVGNKKLINQNNSFDFINLSTRYFLDKFDGIYPINQNWLITRRLPTDIKQKLVKKLLNSSLTISLFNTLKDQKSQYYTVSEYIEHDSLDIALIKVTEPIYTEYFSLGDSTKLIDKNSWVLISGNYFAPSITRSEDNYFLTTLKIGDPTKKNSAAFSKLSKINNQQLELSVEDKQNFYPWAYPLYTERQKNKNTKNNSMISHPNNLEITESIQDKINHSFHLDQTFIGVAEQSDIGGVFLLTKELLTPLTNNNEKKNFLSCLENSYKLILIGLTVPNPLNNGITSVAINLTDNAIQEWIKETIFETETKHYNISEYQYSNDNTSEDEKEHHNISKYQCSNDDASEDEYNNNIKLSNNVKRSSEIKILKPREDCYKHIQIDY